MLYLRVSEEGWEFVFINWYLNMIVAYYEFQTNLVS